MQVMGFFFLLQKIVAWVWRCYLIGRAENKKWTILVLDLSLGEMFFSKDDEGEAILIEIEIHC